jgi:hypothetical protein
MTSRERAKSGHEHAGQAAHKTVILGISVILEVQHRQLLLDLGKSRDQAAWHQKKGKRQHEFALPHHKILSQKNFPPRDTEDTEIHRKNLFRRHSVVSAKFGGKTFSV